jgi:hypothetical protein
MKLDFNQFPAMKNLAEDVREKALEYAKTLGARGPRPTTVLGTAVTLAREWKSGRLPARPVAVPYLVQPRNGRWVIKRSNDELPSHVYMRKDDAVRRAQALAKESGAACFVFGPGGTLIERYEARALAEMHFPEALAEVEVVEAAPVIAAIEVIEAAPVAEVIEAAPVIEVAEAAPPIEVAEVIEVVEAAPPIEVVEMIEVVEAAPPIEVVEVVESAPVIEVIEVVEAAPVTTETVVGSNEPIRVKRVANKWLVMIADGRVETLATKAKAMKRAAELGNKLGRAVIAA